jgi:hypothetical protein
LDETEQAVSQKKTLVEKKQFHMLLISLEELLKSLIYDAFGSEQRLIVFYVIFG